MSHQRDSIDKVVFSYFSCITREPFTYKGKEFLPKPLIVSPLIARGYTCPSECSGCCMTITLDWLPFEQRPDYPAIKPRTVEFNGRKIELLSDLQDDNMDHYCRHVIKDPGPTYGRCAIHFDGKPFTADFELIRFLVFSAPNQPNRLTQKLYGRGWSYTRVDGGKGALCEMTPITEETRLDTIRRMKRLEQWANYFGLNHCLDEILPWLESGPHETQLVANSGVKSDSVFHLTLSPK